MAITALYRIFGLPVLVAGVAVFMSACELEIGDPASVVSGNDNKNTASTDNTDNNNNTGNTGGNTNTNKPPPGTSAPGVPGLLSPGNGELVGAKVDFAWTDAEGAVEFELAVQGLGSGGWQSAANPVTDEFGYSYNPNPAWTQYRWAVRSIGSDGQKSAYAGWRSFSTTP